MQCSTTHHPPPATPITTLCARTGLVTALAAAQPHAWRATTCGHRVVTCMVYFYVCSGTTALSAPTTTRFTYVPLLPCPPLRPLPPAPPPLPRLAPWASALHAPPTPTPKSYPVNWPIGSGDRFVGIYHRPTAKVVLYEKRNQAGRARGAAKQVRVVWRACSRRGGGGALRREGAGLHGLRGSLRLPAGRLAGSAGTRPPPPSPLPSGPS